MTDRVDINHLIKYIQNIPEGLEESLVKQHKIEDVTKFLMDMEVVLTCYKGDMERKIIHAITRQPKKAKVYDLFEYRTRECLGAL